MDVTNADLRFLRPVKVNRRIYETGETAPAAEFKDDALAALLARELVEVEFDFADDEDEDNTAPGDDDEAKEPAAAPAPAEPAGAAGDDSQHQPGNDDRDAAGQSEAAAQTNESPAERIEYTPELTAAELLAQALEAGVICQAGSWFRYKADPESEETLPIAQGRNATVVQLTQNAALRETILNQLS